MKFISAYKDQLTMGPDNEFYASEFFREYCALNCYLNDYQRGNDDIQNSITELIGHLSDEQRRGIEDSYCLLLKGIRQIESVVLDRFEVYYVLFMIGDASIDSHGMLVDGQSILVIDLLAYFYGYDKYNPISFLVHEAFHAYHYKRNPDFYFKQFKTYSENVMKRMFCEGLATYASRILTNESDEDVFWLGYLDGEQIKSWIVFAEESRHKYRDIIQYETMNQDDYARLFSVVDMDKLWENRLGYYYGFQAVEMLSKVHPLEEIASMDFECVSKALQDVVGRG